MADNFEPTEMLKAFSRDLLKVTAKKGWDVRDAVKKIKRVSEELQVGSMDLVVFLKNAEHITDSES